VTAWLVTINDLRRGLPATPNTCVGVYRRLRSTCAGVRPATTSLLYRVGVYRRLPRRARSAPGLPATENTISAGIPATANTTATLLRGQPSVGGWPTNPSAEIRRHDIPAPRFGDAFHPSVDNPR
jgi:hypothetical protein